MEYPCSSRSWWTVEAVVWPVLMMRFVGFQLGPSPSAFRLVAVSVSSGRDCPYLLPLSKTHFLNLSLDVGKRCGGVGAAAWKVYCTLRILIYSLISSNLRVSWHQLNVDLNVWWCLVDVVEIVDYPDGAVLSCCCNWGERPSDGRPVVHKYSDGICLWVLGRPLSSIVCCLQYAV